jgi:acylphosphatase
VGFSARKAEFGRERPQKARKTQKSVGPTFGAILLIDETNGLVEGVAMSPAGQVRHETVHYSGRVQGVGFRYTALQLARGYDVSGFAENLADGRVRVEVEGEQAEVDAFLAAIEERMHGLVRHVERAGGLRAPEFSGFTIQ